MSDHRCPNFQMTLNQTLYSALETSTVLKPIFIIIGYLILLVAFANSYFMIEVSPGFNLWQPFVSLNFLIFLIFDWRYMPLVFLGTLIYTLWTFPSSISLQTSIFITLMTTLIYSFAAVVLRNRLQVDCRFLQLRDLFLFVLVTFVAASVNAVLITVVGLRQEVTSLFTTLSKLWLAEAISLLTLAPFTLIYLIPLSYQSISKIIQERQPKRSTLSLLMFSRRAMFDLLGQIIALPLILYIIFGFAPPVHFSRLYLCFLPLIWITLRHGLRGATANIVAINSGLLFCAHMAGLELRHLAELQLFMLLLSLTGLFLGVVLNQYRQSLQELRIGISERIQAEQALKASETRFQRVVSSISDHIYATEINEKGEYVNSYLSPHIEALTSYPREKFEADWSFWPSVVIHPEDREAAAAQAGRLALGQDSEVEYRLVRADGGIVWVRDSGRAERAGDSIHIYGVVSDITASKQAEEKLQQTVQKLQLAYEHATNYAQELHEEITEREHVEEALRQSEERLRSILDNVVDGIVTVDEHNMIESFNAAAEKIFGYTARDIVGQKFDRLLAIEEMLAVDGALVAWPDGSPDYFGQSREMIGRRQDGSTFPIDVAVSKFYLSERRMFIGIVRDITERKHLERQLRQAQKMEAIGQLAGGVAHDFNNILTVISGHTEMLLRLHADPHDSQREDIELIKKASERAANLTRQLLAFSRQQTLRPQIIDLNIVVSNFKEILPHLIGEDIVLQIDLTPDVGCIKADPGQIEQVLMNLAVNARDAMPKGGQLTIETKNIHLDEAQQIEEELKIGASAYVMLTVTDTGVGMDVETQSRIFDPFFTTKEQGKGTGLGLSMVYGIIRQSEGFIWVESESGQGTTFKICFPRTDWVVESTSPQTPALEAKHSATQGEETILLVEDEASVRLITRRFLQKQNYMVLEANHPEKALELCQQHPGRIDLLITDLVMPYMNGHELAEQLTRLYPDLKVLYISGYADDTLSEQGVLAPDILFLEKPFSSETLVRKVREALSSS